MNLIKKKYKKETNKDCYCGGVSGTDGEYSNEYVHWIEHELMQQLDINDKRKLLINLIRKDIDVNIGDVKGKLFGYRQESFLVIYNHNCQSEWVSIDNILL